MSAMSMPLWRVLELRADPGNGRTIGLDAYPIFDENERDGINRLIIEHFYLRDIGQETISIFEFMLRRTMREIMPTYNQLYRSQQLAFDPLSTYDLTTVRNGTTNETGEGSTESTSKSTSKAGSRAVNFDTPQTALSGNKDYASSAADSNAQNEADGNNTGSSTSKTSAENTDTSRTTGRQGSANRLLTEFRANIINTDLMLLNDPELTSMFMGVWDTGDEIPAPLPFRSRARKAIR